VSAPIAVNIESNYFTLMGLPQRFEVDLKVLKKIRVNYSENTTLTVFVTQLRKSND